MISVFYIFILALAVFHDICKSASILTWSKSNYSTIIKSYAGKILPQEVS